MCPKISVLCVCVCVRATGAACAFKEAGEGRQKEAGGRKEGEREANILR